MGAITEQGIFGIVAAVVGIAAGIFLSRTVKNYRARSAAKKAAETPKVYASRQEMRKAERQQAKKG